MLAGPEHHDHAPHRRAGFHRDAVRVVELDTGLHVPDFGGVVEAEVEVLCRGIGWDEQHDSCAIRGFEPCLVHEAEDVAGGVGWVTEEYHIKLWKEPVYFKSIFPLFIKKSTITQTVVSGASDINPEVELLVQFAEYLRWSACHVFRGGVPVSAGVGHGFTRFLRRHTSRFKHRSQ